MKDCFLSPWNSVSMHSSSLDETCLPMLLDGTMTTSLLRGVRLKQRNSIELGFTRSSKVPCAQHKGTELQHNCLLPWGLRAFHSFECRISNIHFRQSRTMEDKSCGALSHILKLLNYLINEDTNLKYHTTPGFNSTWTMNFQMFKLVLEKAEEPEIKFPISVVL